MTPDNFTASRIEFIKHWLSVHAAGTYELLEKWEGPACQLRVQPHNPLACKIFVDEYGPSMQFNLGEKIWFDDVDGLYADRHSVLKSDMPDGELELLLDAVVNGRVKEMFWMRGDKELVRKGIVTIHGKDFRYKMTSSLRHFFVRSNPTRVIQYEPSY